jgi:hypothetical protein
VVNLCFQLINCRTQITLYVKIQFKLLMRDGFQGARKITHFMIFSKKQLLLVNLWERHLMFIMRRQKNLRKKRKLCYTVNFTFKVFFLLFMSEKLIISYKFCQNLEVSGILFSPLRCILVENSAIHKLNLE